MGSRGRAEISLGLHGMVWVSGHEGPDWRVSGANTLTSAQPAIRLTGASRLDAGDAPPSSCLKTGQRPALKPRAHPEDRTDGGTSFSRLCVEQTKFYFVCTTRTHLAVILIAGFAKTGTMLLLRRKDAEDSSGSRMTGNGPHGPYMPRRGFVYGAGLHSTASHFICADGVLLRAGNRNGYTKTRRCVMPGFRGTEPLCGIGANAAFSTRSNDPPQ